MILAILLKTILTIINGILIGVCLSAPLGPVGSLCLKKTLFDNRREGLLTGYGATVSDMIYSGIVYIFFVFLDAFFNNNPQIEAGIRCFGSILGGVILIIFARLLYKRGSLSPVAEVKEDGERKDEFKKFMRAFLLTFSNFWIIFLIFPLYMNFNFVVPLDKGNLPIYIYYALIAIGSIGAGCLMWWYFFTYTIIRISRSLGQKGIKWFIYTVAMLLGLFGVFGILRGLNTLENFISWSDLIHQII